MLLWFVREPARREIPLGLRGGPLGQSTPCWGRSRGGCAQRLQTVSAPLVEKSFARVEIVSSTVGIWTLPGTFVHCRRKPSTLGTFSIVGFPRNCSHSHAESSRLGRVKASGNFSSCLGLFPLWWRGQLIFQSKTSGLPSPENI